MIQSGNEWLCRNCNSLVDNDIKECPACHAERPEDSASEPTPEGMEEVVTRENYTNALHIAESKYIFREAVLVNAADILLIFGLLCTFGALILPAFLPEIEFIKLWSIAGAIVIFAVSMIQWALFRSIAFISQRLRTEDKHSK